MMAVTHWARRSPLALFLALTYLLSWLPELFGGGLFPFGPLLAVLALTSLNGGRAALRAWWTYVARWRAGFRWYALAIGLPFVMNVGAAGIVVLLGAAAPSAERFVPWSDLLVNFLIYLVAFGPLGEEPGWRGYALPRLLPRRSPLVRTLALALIIVVWYLPLIATGQQPLSALVAVAAAQILYTWLANRSGAPVPIVILAHAAQGGLGGAFFGPLFSGTDAALETAVLAALYCAVALVIVGITGPGLGQQPDIQTVEARTTSVATMT